MPVFAAGYRPSLGSETRRMNHSRACPPEGRRPPPPLSEERIRRRRAGSTAADDPAASKLTRRAMPTGSFAPDFALQDRRGAAGYLALSQDGEHDCRVGRRDRVPSRSATNAATGPNQKCARRRLPPWSEQRPGDPHHDDGCCGGPKSSPTDVHASVEQDADQRHGDDAFDCALRRGSQDLARRLRPGRTRPGRVRARERVAGR